MQLLCDDFYREHMHGGHYWGKNNKYCPGWYQPERTRQEKEQGMSYDDLRVSAGAVKTVGGSRGQVYLNNVVVYETTEVFEDVKDENGRVTKAADQAAFEAAKTKFTAFVQNALADAPAAQG